MTIASNINIIMTQMSELFLMEWRLMCVDHYCYLFVIGESNQQRERKKMRTKIRL